MELDITQVSPLESVIAARLAARHEGVDEIAIIGAAKLAAATNAFELDARGQLAVTDYRRVLAEGYGPQLFDLAEQAFISKKANEQLFTDAFAPKLQPMLPNESMDDYFVRTTGAKRDAWL